MATAQRRGASTSIEVEWASASERARLARLNVAAQVAELIMDTDISGGRGHMTAAIRRMLEAQVHSDPQVMRAACMDVSIAGGMWAVALDLGNLPGRNSIPAG